MAKPRNLLTLNSRRGFTLAETVAALAILAILVGIVAQVVVWSLRERGKRVAHHAAVEIAANVLEEARALPYDELNQAWADGQAIPSEVEGLLTAGKVVVNVEADKLAPGTKRVSVTVQWQTEPDGPRQEVQLATVLSRHEAKRAEGKP
jgi:prepilin-type N-terminal cleavage/methylation domain-containing protein